MSRDMLILLRGWLAWEWLNDHANAVEGGWLHEGGSPACAQCTAAAAVGLWTGKSSVTAALLCPEAKRRRANVLEARALVARLTRELMS